MPTYQYRCNDCGNDLEVVQKFIDPALTVCPSCEGRLRKVFNAVGVVFKGSGFYRTDSRSADKVGAKDGSSGANGSTSEASSNSKGSADSSPSGASEKSTGTATSTEKKPAGKQPAAAGSSN